MQLELLLPLLKQIHGCTFATVDSETWPTKSVRCVQIGERAIIYRTNGGSGYENKIKRKLEEAGKNPDYFKVGELPWGQRIEDLPLIFHKDKYYLTFVQLTPGVCKYYIGTTDVEIQEDQLLAFGVRPRFSSKQAEAGVPPDEQIIVNTYNIENIHRLIMLGKTVDKTSVSTKQERAILRLNFKENDM